MPSSSKNSDAMVETMEKILQAMLVLIQKSTPWQTLERQKVDSILFGVSEEAIDRITEDAKKFSKISFAEKITSCLWKLQKIYNRSVFSLQEIRILAKKVSGQNLKNFPRIFKSCLNADLLEKANQEGEWYQLTAEGSRAAEGGFKNSGWKKKLPQKQSTRREVQRLILTKSVNSHPFNTLPTDGFKVLWMLFWAKLQGVGYLSSNELADISGQLGKKISTRNLGAVIEAILRVGLISKTDQGFVITPAGQYILEILRRDWVPKK